MSNLLEDVLKDYELIEELPHSFGYTIADDSKLVIDRRKDRTLSVDHKDVYFVGHRVMEQGEFRFHLAVIVADDMKSFSRALSEVQDRIGRKFNTRARSMLVYVCNLYSFDRNLQASARHQEIASKIDDHQIRDEYGKYLVYSLLDANRLCLQTVQAKEALAGISSCRAALAPQDQQDFTILKACAMQSISIVFDYTIESRVEQLRIILDTLRDPAATLH